MIIISCMEKKVKNNRRNIFLSFFMIPTDLLPSFYLVLHGKNRSSSSKHRLQRDTKTRKEFEFIPSPRDRVK